MLAAPRPQTPVPLARGFEVSRLENDLLVLVYEQLVPRRRRPGAAGPRCAGDRAGGVGRRRAPVSLHGVTQDANDTAG
jgi:hypothetical protein